MGLVKLLSSENFHVHVHDTMTLYTIAMNFYYIKLPTILCQKEIKFTHIIFYAAYCLNFLFWNLQSQKFQ
jgi:hypothetical protein